MGRAQIDLDSLAAPRGGQVIIVHPNGVLAAVVPAEIGATGSTLNFDMPSLGGDTDQYRIVYRIVAQITYDLGPHKDS